MLVESRVVCLWDFVYEGARVRLSGVLKHGQPLTIIKDVKSYGDKIIIHRW